MVETCRVTNEMNVILIKETWAQEDGEYLDLYADDNNENKNDNNHSNYDQAVITKP